MTTSEVFTKVRRSIVAFASKVSVSRTRKAPAFPTIIGTGFVVDERVIVATNRHVVRALERLPAYPRTGKSAAIALAFSEIEAATGGYQMNVAFVSLRRWDKLTTLKTNHGFYGEPLPDLRLPN